MPKGKADLAGSPGLEGLPSRENRAVPNTVGHTTLDRLREELGRIIGQFDPGVPRAFAQAMKALLTAMEYQDPTLVRSSLEEVLESLRDVTREAIEKRLGWPELSRRACRKIREAMKGFPQENFDELGEGIESQFDRMLEILTDLRDGPVKMLQDKGYEVENAVQLERDIRELQELKQGMLENWPWSSQSLPPVDREMVARSKAAIARGETGESLEELIRRLGGDPSSAGR